MKTTYKEFNLNSTFKGDKVWNAEWRLCSWERLHDSGNGRGSRNDFHERILNQ